jgi:hypothetical protein
MIQNIVFVHALSKVVALSAMDCVVIKQESLLITLELVRFQAPW